VFAAALAYLTESMKRDDMAQCDRAETPLRNAWRAALVAAAGLLWGGASVAQDARGPVVIELYTSQGCSACPPADEMMHDLAARDDVIALALHVDYWDYIGWKDIFARPEHAERQRGFARRMGERMIYTPQMVVDGQAHVVGNKAMKVIDLVRRHAERPDPVVVALERQGGRLLVTAEGRVARPAEVHLVRFEPEQTVEITRGENRGKTVRYVNIVRDWVVLRDWDGAAPLRLTIDRAGSGPVAVLVQEADHGPILGAAALR